MFQKYLRGQVWVYTPLDDKSTGYDTNVQTGKRPCVILSNDVANYHSGTLVVAPCTTALKNKIPTHVKFKNVDNGLINVVMTEQIVTVDKRQMGNYVGMLDITTMEEIEQAMMIELGLTPHPALHKQDIAELTEDVEPIEKHSGSDIIRFGKGNTITGDAVDYMREFVETYTNQGLEKTAEIYKFTKETAKSYYYRYRKKLREVDGVGTDKTIEPTQGQ